jgi:hypothetical protein
LRRGRIAEKSPKPEHRRPIKDIMAELSREGEATLTRSPERGVCWLVGVGGVEGDDDYKKGRLKIRSEIR